MDPISASVLVSVLSKLFDGVTEKAGGQIWDSLTKLIKKPFGRKSAAAKELSKVRENPRDRAALERLAGALAEEAAGDPAFAARLREWLVVAEHAVVRDDSVRNSIQGDVHGTVIQARDINL